MSEDDRAAKAARAKAMLKKRQQKRVGGSAAVPSAGIASPPASPSLRAVSPTNDVPAGDADLNDIFAKGDSDTNWVASLPRVETPPSRPPSRPQSVALGAAKPSSPAISSPLAAPSVDQTEELRSLIQSQQMTILQLESEKASLKESVKRSEESESKSRDMEKRLQAERDKARTLGGRVQQLEADVRVTQEQIQLLTTREKEIVEKSREETQNHQQTIALLVSEKASLSASLYRLEELELQAREKENLLQDEQNKSQELDIQVQRLETELREAADKYREQERELQLTNGTLDDLRGDANSYQRKVRELEEHIQSDDRAEKLEESLKNTQERADELEFQLSKLKQAHGTLKTERDGIDSRLRLLIEAETTWKNRHAELEDQHSAAREQLAAAVAEQEALTRDKSMLQSQFDGSQKTLTDLRQQLSVTAAELVSNTRQLHGVQADLRNANRRADEAEKTQKDLQSEGTNLMRSLDEMRPKIVELTGDKVELGNKIASLEHTLRNRDATIAELESNIEELRYQYEETSKQQEEGVAQYEKEQSSAQAHLAELQKAYTELQRELEGTQASIHGLEAERADHYQLASRQLEEIDRLKMSSRVQAEEVSIVRQELAEHEHLEEEDRGFIHRAQEEIESLRAELASAEDEIQRLRDAVSSTPSPDGAPESLDAEMLSALRQQHALDLSAAQSQIRALETSVFDAQAKSHTLQKQVSMLEDQLAAPSRLGRPQSPSSRPSSRSHNHPHQPNNLSPLSRSVFDIGLTPETRHKRRVSLGMLKARIDSELANVASRPSSRAQTTKNKPMPAVQERKPLSLDHPLKRPQLDENHIFWCSSCKADLIIL